MKESLVTDFYEQLSMLLASKLPLSESIIQLAKGLWRKDFREALLAVGTEVGEGRRLSEAMRRFPAYFHPFHVRMIEKGEESGTLAEILAEIAQSARFNQRLVATVKDVSIYPLLVLLFGGTIFFVILRYVIIEIAASFSNMFGGMTLPILTKIVFTLSMVAVHLSPLVWVAIPVAALFLVWLYSGGVRAQRLLASAAGRLPLLAPVVMNFTLARVCVLWSILVRNKTTEAEIFDIISHLLEDKRLSLAMGRVSTELRNGRTLIDSIAGEKALSQFIPLVVRHTPEKELSGELRNVAEIYGQMAMAASRKAAVAWEVILGVVISFVVALIVIATFMPIIQILKCLGG